MSHWSAAGLPPKKGLNQLRKLGQAAMPETIEIAPAAKIAMRAGRERADASRAALQSARKGAIVSTLRTPMLILWTIAKPNSISGGTVHASLRATDNFLDRRTATKPTAATMTKGVGYFNKRATGK